MNKFLIFLSMLVVFFIFLVFVSSTDNSDTKKASKDEAQWIIKKWEYGDKYPYKIDELLIYCKMDAVWLEDIDGNKYALNGVAKSQLKKDKKYKGGTEAILQDGMLDLFTPDVAFEKCLRIE